VRSRVRCITTCGTFCKAYAAPLAPGRVLRRSVDSQRTVALVLSPPFAKPTGLTNVTVSMAVVKYSTVQHVAGISVYAVVYLAQHMHHPLTCCACIVLYLPCEYTRCTPLLSESTSTYL
jgi:hypothetical protein